MKPRILFMLPFFYPMIGGPTMNVEAMGRELVNRGYDVSVVTSRFSRYPTTPYEMEYSSTFEGMNIFRIHFGDNELLHPDFMPFLVSLQEARHFDIYHCMLPPCHLAYRLIKGMGAKIVHHVQTCSEAMFRAEEPFLGFADKILVNSTEMLGWYRNARTGGKEVFNDASRNVELLYDGVDLELFNGKPKDSLSHTILFNGRLTTHKGLDILASICKRVKPRIPDLKVTVVGQHTGQSIPLPEFFKVVGLTRNVRRYYEEADITVLPSETEGLPRVLLESIAMCRPSIMSAVGAIGEVHGKVNFGYVIPRGTVKLPARVDRTQYWDKDPPLPKWSLDHKVGPDEPWGWCYTHSELSAWQLKIEELLTDKSSYDRFAQNCQRGRQLFGVKAMVDRLEGIYAEVMAK